MLFFLIPLLVGFAANLASAFTGEYSRRWGERPGTVVSVVLRDVLGIPLWALGFLLAAATRSDYLFDPEPVSTFLGWLAIAVGGALIVAALASIRRTALVPTARDVLVRDGAYSLVRHPIHAGAILELAGLVLAAPTATLSLACALGIGWILLQTRLEEMDLVARMPGYGEYEREVPCLIPRLRRP